MAEQKKFNIRGFVSFTLLISFIVISVTGIVLYIVPPGRVAFWINWTLLGMNKDAWGAVHTIFSFLFIVIAAVHLYYNWGIFMSYLRSRVIKGLRLKRELAASVMLTVIIFAGILFELPPFSTTMDYGESIKESWGEGQDPAPAPHTELKTLEEVVDESGMRLENVLQKLERNGVTVENPGETLKTIASNNDISPSELFRIIQKREGGGHGAGQQ